MSRKKGSKNKPKTPDKKENIKVEAVPIKKRNLEKQNPREEVLKVEGVAPRKENPKIPEVLIDGGMLYRWLIELRRHYDELTQDDNKDIKKRVYQIIDEISEYILRMEKK